jgi:hypothetical protein
MFFKWESSGKGRKRSFSSVTDVHYVWDGTTIKAEVSKGNWNLVGEAKDIETVDSLVCLYDDLCRNTFEKNKLEREEALKKSLSYVREKSLFNDTFSEGTKLRAFYVSFCSLREASIPLSEIAARMTGMNGFDKGLLLRFAEDCRLNKWR